MNFTNMFIYHLQLQTFFYILHFYITFTRERCTEYNPNKYNLATIKCTLILKEANLL